MREEAAVVPEEVAELSEESLEEPQSEPEIKKIKFNHQNDVNNRESKPEPEKPKKIICPQCSLSLSSRGSLHNHIKVKHQEGQRWQGMGAVSGAQQKPRSRANLGAPSKQRKINITKKTL